MIRRATPADAKALSALSRTSFTQTFEHLYDPADLEAFLDEAYAPDVLRAELEDPNRATWLLFEDATDEAPIGYATACPANLPHPDVTPGDGELQRLYILQGHQGRGAARSSSTRRSSGSNATARAPCGSACGAKTTGRNASTRATASRSSASTRSWWATMPTASSSPDASRERSTRKPRTRYTRRVSSAGIRTDTGRREGPEA